MKIKNILAALLLVFGITACSEFKDPFSVDSQDIIGSGTSENGSGTSENGSGTSENGSGTSENG